MSGDPLYELIRSLTPEEKRIFKLHTKKYTRKGGNNYLRLFDILDALPEYDEKKLREKLRRSGFDQQLHVTRSYLSELLLDVLARKHEQEDLHLDLQRQLSHAHVLCSKGLYETALKRIRKVRQLCETYERPLQALQAAQLMEKIAVKLNTQELFGELVNDEHARQLRAMERHREYLHYRTLSFRLMHFVNSHAAATLPKENEELRRIGEAVLAPPPAEANAETRILRLSTISVFQHYLGHKKEALRQALKALDIGLRTDLEKLTPGVDSLLNLFNNAAMLLAGWGDERMIDELVEKVRKYKTRNRSEQLAMEERINIILLTQNIALHRYERTDRLLPGIEAFLKENGKQLTAFGKRMVPYNLMIHFFYTGRFRPALKWLNHLLTADFSAMGKHVLENVLLIELILHFELNNSDLLESRLKTNAKLMRKHDTQSPLEDAVIWHFMRLQAEAAKNRHSLIRRLHEELLELKKDPRLAYRFGDFAYDRWAEAHLKKTTIAELAS